MPLHPLLLSFYAVLSLYSENMAEVSIDVIWRLLIVFTLCVAILLVLLRGLTKDWQRSGLILSFFLLLFFMYGHVYNNFKGVAVDDFYVFRHRYLVVVWLLLGIAGVAFIRHIKNSIPFTRFANAMSVIMLLFPLFNIGLFVIRENAYSSTVMTQSSPFKLSAEQPVRDVYFIVLDAYGRADVLQDLFDLDNTEFIRELQDMGFYVVRCSQSNYSRTRLSMASTLNMDYVQNLIPDPDPNEIRFSIKPFLVDSLVQNLFEGLDYKTVAFYNGYELSHWQEVDYFLQLGQRSSLQLQLGSTLTPFEELFLKTTFFRAIIDFQMAENQFSSVSSHREAVLYTLATLPRVPQISSPKFVYAHLILPHSPFVFGPNGEKVNIDTANEETNNAGLYESNATRAGYRDQVIYANRRMISILHAIIENSSTPPIIVLESDHGPTEYRGTKNRMANFMAYYFPGKDVANLAYPSITPVNSFRLVLNTYFGGNYPLLNDISYYSKSTRDFNYDVVPNTCAQQ